MQRLLVPPTEEPVSLQEFKDWAKIEHGLEDALIVGFLTAAREYVERYLGKAILTQSWGLWLDHWPCDDQIWLPRPPVQSLESFRYWPVGGAELVDVDEAVYSLDVNSMPGRVLLNPNMCWPSLDCGRRNSVAIEFVCGWEAAADVPESIKTAIKLITLNWYEHRAATSEIKLEQQEFGVRCLLDPYRLIPVA